MKATTAHEAARKIGRQARRTTDRRFTEILAKGSEGDALRTQYACRGCGQTSVNGGAFGFHVRACTNLDQFDIDLAVAVADAATAGGVA